jgi:hypothetical protein
MTHVSRASARRPSSDAGGGRAAGSAPESRAGIRGGDTRIARPSAAPPPSSTPPSAGLPSAGLPSAGLPSAVAASAAPPSAVPPSAVPPSAVPPSAGRDDRRVWARLLAGFLRRWKRPPPDDPVGGRRSSVTDALFLGGIFPPSDEVMGLSLAPSRRRYDPDR